jgi:hypothetical protein
MTDRTRTERLGDLLWVAFALAVVPNTLNSFEVAPQADWWAVVRAALSTLFVIVLIAYLAGRIGERRRRGR